MSTIAVVTTDQNETDRNLAERHLHGEPEAFEEVYTRFSKMVYNLALRMSGSESEAADCAQETFLRVYRHLGKFRGRSNLKTWVFRIALNSCRTRFRRRAMRRRWIDSGEEDLIARTPASGRSPEDRAAAAEAARRVQSALDALEPAFREAVVLRDLQGFSYKEVASVLGVRIGTVRSRIARGREQLRQIMERES